MMAQTQRNWACLPCRAKAWNGDPTVKDSTLSTVEAQTLASGALTVEARRAQAAVRQKQQTVRLLHHRHVSRIDHKRSCNESFVSLHVHCSEECALQSPSQQDNPMLMIRKVSCGIQWHSSNGLTTCGADGHNDAPMTTRQDPTMDGSSDMSRCKGQRSDNCTASCANISNQHRDQPQHARRHMPCKRAQTQGGAKKSFVVVKRATTCQKPALSLMHVSLM